MINLNIEELVKIANEGKKKAYAPYSGFKVGSALLTNTDKIYQGSNIENISFTPTVCAERTAIFAAILAGQYKFKAIAISTDDVLFSPPCGVCRQVMSEFVDSEFTIILVNLKGEKKIVNFSEIFPFPFRPKRKIGNN